MASGTFLPLARDHTIVSSWAVMGDYRIITVRLVIVSTFFSMGCLDSANLVLKPPIRDRCSAVGLRGCDELTDGVLLYVEGDKDTAETKIKVGAAQNAPSEVREFAAKLRALKGIPGADKYTAPLMEVADLLAPESGPRPTPKSRPEEDAASVAVAASNASTSADPRPPQDPPHRHIAGTSVPSVDLRAQKCILFTDTPWESDSTVGRCVRLALGALVLTDVQTTGACHDLLAIGAGDPMNPRWVLVSEPASSVSIHGARYAVGPDEPLFVAQKGDKEDALGRAVSCSISWAGER